MALVAFIIGHSGTMLNKTLDHITAAFSTVHPRAEQAIAKMGIINLATYLNSRIHDFSLFKSMFDLLTDLA